MKTFSENERISNIDTNRDFIVLRNGEGYIFKDGDILEYIEGEHLYNIPLMRRKSDGYKGYIQLYKLYYNEGQTINNDYMDNISDDDIENTTWIETRWDLDECRECQIISPDHLFEYFKWVTKR